MHFSRNHRTACTAQLRLRPRLTGRERQYLKGLIAAERQHKAKALASRESW